MMQIIYLRQDTSVRKAHHFMVNAINQSYFTANWTTEVLIMYGNCSQTSHSGSFCQVFIATIATVFPVIGRATHGTFWKFYLFNQSSGESRNINMHWKFSDRQCSIFISHCSSNEEFPAGRRRQIIGVIQICRQTPSNLVMIDEYCSSLNWLE